MLLRITNEKSWMITFDGYIVRFLCSMWLVGSDVVRGNQIVHINEIVPFHSSYWDYCTCQYISVQYTNQIVNFHKPCYPTFVFAFKKRKYHQQCIVSQVFYWTIIWYCSHTPYIVATYTCCANTVGWIPETNIKISK